MPESQKSLSVALHPLKRKSTWILVWIGPAVAIILNEANRNEPNVGARILGGLIPLSIVALICYFVAKNWKSKSPSDTHCGIPVAEALDEGEFKMRTSMKNYTTKSPEQHDDQHAGVSLQRFTVFIPEALSIERGYARMVHSLKYSLVLRNGNETRCDADVTIDGQKVGVWRIDPHGEIRLERPVHDTGCFTFYRLGTPEATKAQIIDDTQAGLITVKFMPERRVRDDGNRYQAIRRAAGGTGLSGKSQQEFSTVAALDYDWENQITIHLRLIAGEDEPRPLKPRATVVPPPVD